MKLQSILRLTVFIFLLALAGCASTQTSGDAASPEDPGGIVRNEPYFPTKFDDFEIPGELEQDYSKTMFINTSSFTGGILNFTGRVEVASLTDFFINSMQKNGWKLAGEVRYENIMLAFNKPHKNCMVTIYPGDFATKTKVYVYLMTEAQKNGSEENL